MSEHTPTPWFHRQANEIGRFGESYSWIADHPDRGMHKKIIVGRDGASPKDMAFIVEAVNNHEALVTALEICRQWMPTLPESDRACRDVAIVETALRNAVVGGVKQP